MSRHSRANKYYIHNGKRYRVWVDPDSGEQPPEPDPPKVVKRTAKSQRVFLAQKILDPNAAVLPQWALDRDTREELETFFDVQVDQAYDVVAQSEDKAMFVDEVDPSRAHTVTAAYEWRTQAVRLAFEHGLYGQAWRDTRPNVLGPERVPLQPGCEAWGCVSIHEKFDRRLVWNPLVGTVQCGCPAGRRQNPCGHAGAVLLAVAGICAQRERDPQGHSKKPGE